MTLRFDLTIEDWVNFQEYYKEKKAPLYKFLMPILGITAIMLICLNVLYLMHNPTSLVTLLSGIFLLLIGCLFVMKKKSVKVLRKAATNLKEKNPSAFGEREMKFDTEQITILAGTTKTELSWKEVDQWAEGKTYFYIYNVKGFVYIVPKRAIEEVDAFVEMLNTNFLASAE